MEVKVIAQMDNTIDNTFESANRIYDVEGLAPTLPTGCGGGSHTENIGANMEIKRVDAFSTRMVRTELGKMLRKDYESHKIHHKFNEHRVMEIGGGTF